jgi:hypothetical protein
MKLTVDANKILAEAGKKPDRKRRTFYVSEGLYKDFQKECDETPPSLVIESLMRLFVDSKRGSSTGKK